MIGEEVKDGSTSCVCWAPVHFAAFYLYRAFDQVVDFLILLTVPFLSVIVLMKILSGQGIVVYRGLN